MNLFLKKSHFSNVIGPKAFHAIAKKTLKEESLYFRRTLGPGGMYTILEDQYLSHMVTKDGYMVYNKIVAYDRVARTIVKLIQKISGSLNELVGDGTTSAVIEANELYVLRNLIQKHRFSPKIITDIIKYVSQDMITKKLYERAITIHKDIFDTVVHHVASISLNNDYYKGRIIADLFNKLQDPLNGFINIEISRDSKTYYETDRGFEIKRGLVISEMVNDPDGKHAVYNNPAIVLVKGSLNSSDFDAIATLLDYTVKVLQKPLVIIAGGFSLQLLDIFKQSIITHAQKEHKILPLAAVEIDTDSSIGKDILLDIEAAIGAHIIIVEDGRPFPLEENYFDYKKYMGGCEKIIMDTSVNTRIIRGNSDKQKIAFRVESLEEELKLLKSAEHIENTNEITKLLRRKATLLNDMVTLHIGGDTYQEKETDSHLFIDAVHGVKSALQHGIVQGGNITVAQICHELLSTLFNKMTKENSEALYYIFDDIYKTMGHTKGVNRKKLFIIIKDILKYIKKAYIKSYAIILHNQFRNWGKAYKISKYCAENNCLYNIVTNRYEKWPNSKHNIRQLNNDIMKSLLVVNSVETDTQILKAAISIIDLIITTNQFVRIPEREKMIENT
jgi:chaperonin GroEL